MIINPYIYGVATSYDPDAQLFFNAQTGAGVTLTTTEMNAVNQWVVDSKAIGIWTKMKAVYPFVGNTASSQKWNLVNPVDSNAAYRLVFSGGGTFSSAGYLPNGTNAFADTFFIPSVNGTLNSNHISYYSRTNSNGTEVEIGTNISGVVPTSILEIRTSGVTYAAINSGATYTTFTDANSLGLYIGNRTASNVIKLHKNASIVASGTTASTSQSTSSFAIGALNSGTLRQFYTTKQCAFASIGDGLTDLESQLFYQITEKYQVALGRNINATQSFYYNSAYNNETNAFLFSTQITDNTIQTATNTLVSDLKTANIFTKMKAIYPMVGGTATTCKFNLANAQDSNAAFRLVFTGGFTFSSTGALPNGTNTYASTFLIPATSLSASSSHVSIYNRTAGSGTINDWGTSGGALAFATAISLSGTAYLDCYNSTTNRIATANADGKGFYIGNRQSSTSLKLFKNAAQLGTTNANASVGVASLISPLNLFAYNPATNFSNRECAFASIGDGLTDAESLAFYNAVQTFNTTLARQV